MIKVYHNTQCSKSNACLLFLEQSGKPFEIVDYLNDTPSAEELRSLIEKLGIDPIGLVRQKENLWQSEYAGKNLTDEEIILALVKHPVLIERPIVVNGEKAVIARPLELAANII